MRWLKDYPVIVEDNLKGFTEVTNIEDQISLPLLLSLAKQTSPIILSAFVLLTVRPFLCRGPRHHPVIFARAQHIHHIIRQESIFNISEHHNPRQGKRGGFTSHMAERKRGTDRQIERKRKWKKERTSRRNTNCSLKTDLIREDSGSNTCKRTHTHTLSEEVVFDGNHDPPSSLI